MTKISAKQMQSRLQQVANPTWLQNQVHEIILKHEKEIKLIKEQDFLEGDIYGDGTLVSYRSKNYELFKAQKNPLAGGAVDLIDKGDFVDAMHLLKPKGNRYMFGNKDKKRRALVEKYSNKIFGLNQDAFNKFQKEILAPKFKKIIQKQING
jgi:hypothetical protein